MNDTIAIRPRMNVMLQFEIHGHDLPDTFFATEDTEFDKRENQTNCISSL